MKLLGDVSKNLGGAGVQKVTKKILRIRFEIPRYQRYKARRAQQPSVLRNYHHSLRLVDKTFIEKKRN